MPPDHEIYPMPLFPRLTVSDVAASTDWYEALGFDVVHSMPVMAHVRYRKYADVMLADESAIPSEAGSPSNARPGSGVSIFVTVESDSVEDLATRARSNGIEVRDGPRDTPWNTRELKLADPDGYEFVFSEGPLDEGASFDEVVGSTNPEVSRRKRNRTLLDILSARSVETPHGGGSATDPWRQLAGSCALLWDCREGVVSPTSRGRPTRIARAVPSA